MPFTFSEEAVKKALEEIYHEQIDVATEIQPDLFNETWRIINTAVDKGFSQARKQPDISFENEVRYNNAVFSAFKVQRMQNDIAARLLDQTGKLKPFSAFSKDVQPILDHNNRQWLRSEYNTAVIRAHRAADWKQFMAEKDILPNLKWIPTTSHNPGLDHRPFWGTVLPVDDAFWDAHKPGDRWNCKCSLEATDKATTSTPSSNSTKDQPAPGLENNPAKDKRIFSDSHPYFPTSCATCPLYNSKLSAGRVRRKDCYECEYAKSMMQTGKIQEMKQGVKQLFDNIENIGHAYSKPIPVGVLPENAVNFLKGKLALRDFDVVLLDNRVKHALREIKNKRNATVTVQNFINLPETLNTMHIYWDMHKHNFIFTDYQRKFVVQPNYKFQYNKETLYKNVVITAARSSANDYNSKVYKKIE